jgi:hypothetical protein
VRRASLVALALCMLAACHRGASSPAVVLDGRARPPSDQGVITTVDRQHIVLDGVRSYSFASGVVAFSTQTLQHVALLGRIGQYVQVGTRNHAVTWVATFSVVLQLPGRLPTAYYVGRLRRLEPGGRTAVFVDGTVLRLAPGVTAPAGTQLRAEIDPTAHEARALVKVSD